MNPYLYSRDNDLDAQGSLPCHLPSSESCSPLLRLPAELRLRIYSFVAPDFSLRHPPSQYTGLIYTCRRTRAEVEAEFLNVFVCFLNNLKDFMLDRRHETLIIPEPTSFHEMRNLIITRQQSDEMFTRIDSFMQHLAGMFFQSLKIKAIGAHDQTLVLQQRSVRSLARYLSKYCKYERYPSAQKIVFEFEYPVEEHDSVLTDASRSLCRHEAWVMEKEKDEKGRVLRVHFEPAPGFYHAREKTMKKNEWGRPRSFLLSQET